MVSNPKLSILVPTYNRCGSIANLLSHLTQIVDRSYEIIVSNDASNDETENVLVQFSSVHNVKIFNQSKNLGIPGNLNFLYEKSSGKFICFLHDHDVPHSLYFEKLVDALESTQLKIAYSNVTVLAKFHDEKVSCKNSIVPGRQIRKEFQVANNFSCKVNASAIFDRDILNVLDRKVPFLPEFNFFADVELWLSAASHSDYVFFSDELLFLSNREIDHSYYNLNWQYFLYMSRIYFYCFTNSPNRFLAQYYWLKKIYCVAGKQSIQAFVRNDYRFLFGLRSNSDELFGRQINLWPLRGLIFILSSIGKIFWRR
jgi:glycosyltransferase involved in cell wall biosynthesis